MPSIYIVSGFPRSGTSMMMRALEAGGIPCVYSREGDDHRNRNAVQTGYTPNPHGFYENADLRPEAWKGYAGRAVKVIHGNLHHLPAMPLRVVYMRRDPVEINASHDATESGCNLGDYRAKVNDDLDLIHSLAIDWLVLNYADVIANPRFELSRLDWPFNHAAAAAVIDPALYRHRSAA